MSLTVSKQDASNDFMGVFITFIQNVILIALLPLLAMFVTGNLNSENLSFFYTYGIIGLFGLAIIFVAKLAQKTAYGKKSWLGNLDVIHHDPENGLLGIFFPDLAKRLFRYRFRVFALTLLVPVLYSVIAQSPVVVRESFIGQSAIPIVPFEVNLAGKIILETFPSAPAESIFMVGIGGVFATLVVLLFARNSDRRTKLIFFHVGFIVSSVVIAVALHEYRYGASDINIFLVMKFWLVAAVFTSIVGSLVVYETLHYLNNFIVGSVGLLSSDQATTILFFIIAFITLIWILFEIRMAREPQGAAG